MTERSKHSTAALTALALAVAAVIPLLAPSGAPALQPAADEYQLDAPGVTPPLGRDSVQIQDVRPDRDRAGVVGENIATDTPLEALGGTGAALLALLAAIASLAWIALGARRVVRAG